MQEDLQIPVRESGLKIEFIKSRIQIFQGVNKLMTSAPSHILVLACRRPSN